MGRLDGKVAVITGAGAGFGKESAELFAKEGAKVIVADIDGNTGTAVADSIKSEGNEATFVKVDVRNLEECKSMLDLAVKQYGAIDVMVCFANETGDLKHDVAHMDQQKLRDVLDVNVIGTWNCLHYVAPIMVANKKGSIITLGSVDGIYSGNTGYGPSKAAVIAMTIGVANELGRYGVRANSISPYVTKRQVASCNKEYVELLEKNTAMGKLIEEDDVANVALYLASDDCTTVTGIDVWVDNGAIKGVAANRNNKC